jgi:hypothetical protein
MKLFCSKTRRNSAQKRTPAWMQVLEQRKEQLSSLQSVNDELSTILTQYSGTRGLLQWSHIKCVKPYPRPAVQPPVSLRTGLGEHE